MRGKAARKERAQTVDDIVRHARHRDAVERGERFDIVPAYGRPVARARIYRRVRPDRRGGEHVAIGVDPETEELRELLGSTRVRTFEPVPD